MSSPSTLRLLFELGLTTTDASPSAEEVDRALQVDEVGFHQPEPQSLFRANLALRNATGWVGCGWERKEVKERVHAWGVQRIKQVIGELLAWWDGVGALPEMRTLGDASKEGCGRLEMPLGKGGLLRAGEEWGEVMTVRVAGGDWWGERRGPEVGCPHLEGQGKEVTSPPPPERASACTSGRLHNS